MKPQRSKTINPRHFTWPKFSVKPKYVFSCEKNRYESLFAAHVALARIQRSRWLDELVHGASNRRERAVYECDVCKGFHLTSSGGLRVASTWEEYEPAAPTVSEEGVFLRSIHDAVLAA